MKKKSPLGQVTNFHKLTDIVTKCRLCPRLVQYRQQLPALKKYEQEHYWRKPLPGHGDPKAWLLIAGLAPSAHGGNRTGRIFTGDLTARFLFERLHHAGLANQPSSESIHDGLKLKGCYLTAVVKCAPPHNLPSLSERKNCSRYFYKELELLKELRSILVLGEIAFTAFKQLVNMSGIKTSHLRFKHGAKYEIERFPTLYVSYHPSPRNTHTGTLTAGSFDKLLRRIIGEQKLLNN